MAALDRHTPTGRFAFVGTASRGPIVLMDDSEIGLTAAEAVLRERGFDVRGASNLEQLERAIRGVQPSLVVLDVQMPEMFGDDVAKVMRKVRQMSVPIVLFSDLEEPVLAERGREAGVQGWVPKRAGLSGLVEHVERLLRRHGNDA
jgi:DNA-binding response OmpR family regulator